MDDARRRAELAPSSYSDAGIGPGCSAGEENRRCDLEWCVPAADLHDYAGKISIEQRQMRVGGLGCFNLLGGRDCDFATWSAIAPSLFLRYEMSNGSCNVFAKDTARILEVSRDASYVQGSRRSYDAVEGGALSERELVDAGRLVQIVEASCRVMARGDALLRDTYRFMRDHIRRPPQKDLPSLLLLMMGDADTHHAVSSSGEGFRLDPKMWTGADLPRIVGILHAAPLEGAYPARVFTRAGASSQARAWIKAKFEKSALFQSFCHRWGLGPRAVLAKARKRSSSNISNRRSGAIKARNVKRRRLD